MKIDLVMLLNFELADVPLESVVYNIKYGYGIGLPFHLGWPDHITSDLQEMESFREDEV